MKTDINNKFPLYNQKVNPLTLMRGDDIQDYKNDLNEERIISLHKPRDKVFYYDNSAISMSYGQYNVEKCLIVLFIMIIYTSCLLYNYFATVNNILFILLLVCLSLDIIVSFVYVYFLIKLKSDNLFNRIPTVIVNSNDYIILINFLIKIGSIIYFYFTYINLGYVIVSVFTIKFLIDLYFAIISVKLLMFCPCSVYVQEQSEKIWVFIKYYLFCDTEDNENLEYTRMEDNESFY